MEKRIILITGANRGLGAATGIKLSEQGHHVIFTARNTHKLSTLKKQLSHKHSSVDFIPLDVRHPDSIIDAYHTIASHYPQIDTLINNAGIYTSGTVDISTINDQAILEAFNTNTLGPLKITQQFLPLIKQSPEGIIVNVSSGMGAIVEMDSGSPAYRISKTALNVTTKLLHHELYEQGIKVNSVCPGWVRTEMGGPSATLSIDEGISGIIWAATLKKEGPSGGFFRHGKPLQW
ncbi:MAG: SDR family NAD(P)-dependent oxidoreductase [Methylococcales bacterium]|jgi:short-subunit dehydrogenase|nr:SDR family NAD(P)-dependent oxidoreductase [Methylococcales bacterium]MBT3698670.1 SDR family NAD(P)-dependent oxidoreductase [Methylococcales bacterium]MBT4600143.1 SDR family NAD(P)-dependent oxidoreductase [Methylococcales bacterium]